MYAESCLFAAPCKYQILKEFYAKLESLMRKKINLETLKHEVGTFEQRQAMLKSKQPNTPESTSPAKYPPFIPTPTRNTHTHIHTLKRLASCIKDFVVDPCISNVFYFLYIDALMF